MVVRGQTPRLLKALELALYVHLARLHALFRKFLPRRDLNTRRKGQRFVVVLIVLLLVHRRDVLGLRLLLEVEPPFEVVEARRLGFEVTDLLLDG